MPKSDEELAVSHLQGDEKAFPELVRRYQDVIFRFALSFCKSKQDAEDIAQNTFIKVYEHLPKSKTHLSFKPWIFTICTNLCKNLARKKRSFNFTELEYTNTEGHTQSVIDTISDKKADVQDFLHKKELKVIIKTAVDKLPEQYKTVIIMRYFDDFSYKEIAEILKIPLNTVKTNLKRAKTKLETHLKYIL
jgi:RNA polymerase sigma factor (sigma-70 family)